MNETVTKIVWNSYPNWMKQLPKLNETVFKIDWNSYQNRMKQLPKLNESVTKIEGNSYQNWIKKSTKLNETVTEIDWNSYRNWMKELPKLDRWVDVELFNFRFYFVFTIRPRRPLGCWQYFKLFFLGNGTTCFEKSKQLLEHQHFLSCRDISGSKL